MPTTFSRKSPAPFTRDTSSFSKSYPKPSPFPLSPLTAQASPCLGKCLQGLLARVETPADQLGATIRDADDQELFVKFENVELLLHPAPPECLVQPLSS